ncbi:MAG TPA: signal peptidase I [Fimbriimonas sp.]|nr:signal peptidase I [Fimbriimonas sp.]
MRKAKKRAITGFGVVLSVVLVFAIFLYLNCKMVQVSGVSMLPTLKDGQKVLVSKAYWLVGQIHKGDIVVIRDDTPTGFMIKRIHFMPGDKVDWKWVPDNWRLADGPMVVPEGEIFVMGDNKPQSEDSRRFGTVPLADVLGKVVVWP